jgi:hypothetical protein
MRTFRFIQWGVVICALCVFYYAVVRAATVSPEGLVKGSDSVIYYVGADGVRHAFPNEDVYFSWYSTFLFVQPISDAELASIPLGQNITYRPGAQLVKLPSDPRVYAVDGRQLRWVKSETLAELLYGGDWTTRVHDLPEAFFTDYVMGSDIDALTDFFPSAVRDAFPDLQMLIVPSEPPSVEPIPEPEPSLAPVPTSTVPVVPSDTIPPTEPADVRANPLTDQSVFLTWIGSRDNMVVKGYTVFRNGTPVGVTQETHYTDYGLTPGSLYLYQVSAFDAEGNESVRSAPQSAATPLPPRTGGGGGDSDVIAYWPLNEGSGSSTANMEGGNYNGVLQSTTTWVGGISGNALFFGSENSYVSVGSISELRGIQQFTLSAWMKRASTSSQLFVGDANAANEEGVGIYMSGGGVGRVRFHVGDVGTTAYGFIDVPGVDWHHYAMVFDGTKSGNSQRLKLYKDGVQQSVGFSGTIPSVTHSRTVNFFIGRFGSYGTIDEVHLYNRPLTSAEIASLAGL